MKVFDEIIKKNIKNMLDFEEIIDIFRFLIILKLEKFDKFLFTRIYALLRNLANFCYVLLIFANFC